MVRGKGYEVVYTPETVVVAPSVPSRCRTSDGLCGTDARVAGRAEDPWSAASASDKLCRSHPWSCRGRRPAGRSHRWLAADGRRSARRSRTRIDRDELVSRRSTVALLTVGVLAIPGFVATHVAYIGAFVSGVIRGG